MSSGDIRVALNFRDNRKTRKLIRQLGMAGIAHLVYLWLGVAQSRHNGCLLGWTEEDICDEARWKGDSAEFIGALESSGFIEYEFEKKCWVVHDWVDHQPFVAGEPMRRLRAKFAISKRYGHIPKDMDYDGFLKAYRRKNTRSIQGETHADQREHEENEKNDQTPVEEQQKSPAKSKTSHGKKTASKPEVNDSNTPSPSHNHTLPYTTLPKNKNKKPSKSQPYAKHPELEALVVYLYEGGLWRGAPSMANMAMKHNVPVKTIVEAMEAVKTNQPLQPTGYFMQICGLSKDMGG